MGGWLAFEPDGETVLVMGDLVLTQDEVNPVVKKLEERGIRITALHNHLLRAEPATMYLHVMGRGYPVKVAQALHEALALRANDGVLIVTAKSSAAVRIDGNIACPSWFGLLGESIKIGSAA